MRVIDCPCRVCCVPPGAGCNFDHDGSPGLDTRRDTRAGRDGGYAIYHRIRIDDAHIVGERVNEFGNDGDA